MAVSEEKCISCGTRYRPGGLESVSDNLEPGGAFFGLPYWFCSVECYKKAVRKHIEDKRYDFDKDVEDDEECIKEKEEYWVEYHAEISGGVISQLVNPFTYRYRNASDYMREKLQPFFERYERNKKTAILGAEIELSNRLEAEWLHQIAENEAEAEKEREKRREKISKLSEEVKQLEAAKSDFEEMLEPKPIPAHIRLEHTHILGPSGSGKTTLLQNDILEDFLNPDLTLKPVPPAYIFIDPKGLAIERLSRLQLFEEEYKDRIVIVDPLDAPALNLFQTTGRNPAQLISDFGYIFSTTKQKLTGKQAPCFSFCARLLFTLPHANLFTLLDLLDDRTHKKAPNPVFQQIIPTLPPVARRFFEVDFYGPNYASTREEIKARIWGVLENDTLSAMLNANTRKLDIAKCIREGKIVLVNTRMTQLKEAHQTLGRYIIALAQDAIQSRTEKHPVYIVIDEFQEFADAQKTPEMLRLLREYNGGAVLAHQNMYCSELDDDTRNAISTNTSIKYASSPEGQDLNYMARDLRCEADFLKAQHKSDTHAHFACFVRGMKLDHPFVVQSEFGWIDHWPKMKDEAYKELRERNKAALADTQTAPSISGAESVSGVQTSIITHEATEKVASREPLKLPAEADPPISSSENKSDPNVPSKWIR